MTRDWIPTAKNAVNQIRDATGAVRALYPRMPIIGLSADGEASVEKVVSALEEFVECVRYLNTRRSSGAIIEINKEADLQDVVYLMLRPWVRDLVPENPTDKVASRFVIKDFLSKQLAMIVEAKYIREKKHGHDISKEMHDDIEMYRNHPDCRTLVFFTYDRDAYIPDVAALKRQIEGIRSYGDKRLAVFCVVKP
jgi:hypothetical protein